MGQAVKPAQPSKGEPKPEPRPEATVSTLVQSRPVPLPTKIDDWERKINSGLTLNDYVEEVHRALWENDPDYRNYLEAVWDSDAVEGSLAIDNTMAAMKIRDKAVTINGNPVGKKKLDTIVKSLGVVLRRYENSRRERRDTVQGVRVPSPSNGD
jgi:hypothetical protein